MRTEDERARRLLDAQANAVALFGEVVARGIITAGAGRASGQRPDQGPGQRDVRYDQALAQAHRAGRTAHPVPYQENPPDRVIEADDIAFSDFGPIFDEFEADLGRTYVLGDDPVKHRLAADLPVIFSAGRRYFASHPDITGGQLYAEVARLTREAGWSFGNTHAGHLVGEFPHEKIDGADIESYITPGNTTPMRRHDKAGRVCHWILEIHLTDAGRGFGGFYEQLLDI